MGEQPMFTTKAHVFQIDPETKRSWLPMSKQAVPVSFYHDPGRNCWRIISVDGMKALVNSTISSAMSFTKTAQKFGQWSDTKANTVYGLGFQSEGDLNKFSEKFKEAKEGNQTPSSPDTPTSSTAGTVVNTGTPKSTTEMNGVPLQISTGSGKSISSSNSSYEEETGGSHKSLSNSTESQLKYENDRLKKALAQSSANFKKWETELQTLKNNNARLTAALQESTINVEKWKEQLNNYKEENGKLRKKVNELESGLGLENQETKEGLERNNQDLHTKLAQKQEEISRLTKNAQQTTALEERLDGLNLRFQQQKNESTALKATIQQKDQKIQELQTVEEKVKELKGLQLLISEKYQELLMLQNRVSATLQ